MVQVALIEYDGTEHVVEAEPGHSLMESAQRAGVPGILADCGGSSACGTCRVYVDPAWIAKMVGPSDHEDAILELDQSGASGCRLSCQIIMTSDLDGLVVRLPESQF